MLSGTVRKNNKGRRRKTRKKAYRDLDGREYRNGMRTGERSRRMMPPGFKIFFFYIYLFLRNRVRQSMSRGGVEREGDTESEADSRLRAVSPEPDAGLEPTNREIVTRAEVGRSTD